MSSTDPLSAFALEGKTVLVTGASSGIGAATALMCADLGARLVINARDTERLENTFRSLAGEGHVMVAGDLTDPEVRTSLLGAVDGYDGLVACAGIAALVPFRMANEQHFQKMLDINYLAPVMLTQSLLYRRRLRANSSVVYITAVAGHTCPQATSGYAASKAALEAASRSLALEQARQKIRVNCISPGYVDTPMVRGLGASVNMNDNMSLTPLGSIETKDIALGAAYLLSDASRWVTRSTLTIDGGISIPVRI